MKRINLTIAGIIFVFSGIAYSQKQSTVTAVINTSIEVPIYEYKPKIIIEGKWGTAPGEFGGWDEPWNGTVYEPSSMAVDSKGNIYILDFINNRIQKFDNEGKYLLSISVDGCSYTTRGWEEEVFVNGIKIKKNMREVKPDFKTLGLNILIDSKDTLYYYLKRTKNGKETGEVWEIKDDKVIKKMKQGEEKPEKELRSFNIKTLANNSKEVEFTTSKKSFKLNFTTSLKMNKASKFLVIEPRIKGKHIFIPSGVSTGKYIKKGEIFESERLDEKIYIFNQEGNIEGIISGGIPGLFDGYGNAYNIAISDKGVVVTKFTSGVEK